MSEEELEYELFLNDFEMIIESLYQTYRVSYADRLSNSLKAVRKHIEEIYYE